MSKELDYIIPALRPFAVPIVDLVLDPKNARKHDDRNIIAIKKSLKKHRQRIPIVVQKQGMVVRAGNGRVIAAKALKWSHIAALVVDESEVEATAFAIADNRTAELAEWDSTYLGEAIQLVAAADAAAYDVAALIDSLGFNPRELSRLSDGAIRKPDPDVSASPSLLRKWKVERGQIWNIEDVSGLVHRVGCGDSTDPVSVQALVGGEVIDFVFTSPPYNVGVNYSTHKDLGEWLSYRRFLESVVKAFLPKLAKGRVVAWNIGVSPKTAPHRQAVMLEELGLSFVRQAVWRKQAVPVPTWQNVVKDPSARNYTPNFVHEMVYLFSYGKVQKGSKVEVVDELRDDVFDLSSGGATTCLPKTSDSVIDGSSRTGANNGGLTRNEAAAHPAPFPVGLPAMFLQRFADPGAVVYDPFVGSGTTILAAEHHGRRGMGLDLDPAYVAVVLERMTLAGCKCSLA